MKTTKPRIDAVFIRKSSPSQDDQAQRDSVFAMLKARGVSVPPHHWFSGTVSRRKVKANAEFNRLMELVEADRVGTVYVESQDRWGTADRPELFSLLGTLRQHKTRLFDLRAGKDLTERDLATEMLAFVNSIKSEKELQDLAQRSLRTKISLFQESGSWPSGPHPYGYGKRCYAADGKLLWEWQPTSRKLGQLFYPDNAGRLTAGPAEVPLPRKARGQRHRTQLVPGSDPQPIRAVRLLFDLYTRVGLSRRQVSARLNAEGLKFYGKPFSHTDVTRILENRAYAGDTLYGRCRSGVYQTMDETGLVVPVNGDAGKRQMRDAPLVKKDTHEALVDRATWELAQKKLAAERERNSYAPRNPAHYLKQLLVCGHCGKGMIGRTETHPTTKEPYSVYLCSTYAKGQRNAHAVPCGCHRITHEDAERLLLDKLKALNLTLDDTASTGARANLQARLARLGHESEEFVNQWQTWFLEGVDALALYFIDEYGTDWPELKRVRERAAECYLDEEMGTMRTLPVATIEEFRQAIAQAESRAVAQAQRKVADLRAEHKTLTLRWAKATDEMQTVLRQEIERLESDIRLWEPRTAPLSERLKTLEAAEAERKVERQKVLAEWPALEAREKGEAMRRLFRTVTLFWERTWHPAETNPRRPRKTERPGRYHYRLKTDQIKWGFAAVNLEPSSARKGGSGTRKMTRLPDKVTPALWLGLPTKPPRGATAGLPFRPTAGRPAVGPLAWSGDHARAR